MVSLRMAVTVLPQPRHYLKVVVLGKAGPARRIAMVSRQTVDGNRKFLEVASAFQDAQQIYL